MQTTQANGVAGASVAPSRKLFFTTFAAFALTNATVHAASAGGYTIKELPPPAHQSYPYDINNHGVVVGQIVGNEGSLGFIYSAGSGGVRTLGSDVVTAINDRGEYVGISYSGGEPTSFVKRESGAMSINYPSDCGPSGTYAWDINGSGTAVGYYYVCLSPGLFTWRGFRLIDDTPQDLNDTADLGSEASAINDLGHAVGYFQEIDDIFQTENAVKRAALFTGSTPQKLYSANVESVATDINNNGWIVGWWRELSMGDFAERPVHAFLRSNGGNQTLFEGIANAINNNGQVVGSKDTSSGQRAVRWQNGQLEILDDLLPVDSGWELHSADAINDKGEIVGYGLHNGEFRAFILTPTPCPEGYEFSITLPAIVDRIPTSLKQGSPNLVPDLTAELSAITLTCTVQSPNEAGAICEVVTDGTRAFKFNVSYLGVDLGSRHVANVSASVRLTLFEAASAPSLNDCTPILGARRCYLNNHVPGHAVVRWLNRGFEIRPLLPVAVPPWNTGPLEVWVDIESPPLNLAPSTPIEVLMERVEQFIEQQNTLIVYYRNAFIEPNPVIGLPLDVLLTVFDPGRTHLLVTSPTGERTGMTATGNFIEEIPLSAYFPEVPLVVVAGAIPGNYAVEVRGVEEGDYVLATSAGDFTSVKAEKEFSGHLNVDETVVHSAVVPPRLTARMTGQKLLLSWPPIVSDFVLEHSDNLSSSIWTTVPGVSDNQIEVSIDAGAHFYRLRSSLN